MHMTQCEDVFHASYIYLSVLVARREILVF